MIFRSVTRREFLHGAAVASAIVASSRFSSGTSWGYAPPLQTFEYGAVSLNSPLHVAQFENCHHVLMGLNEDSLLKPFRQMAGKPAPGDDLGGWYGYNPDYDYRKANEGFAPAETFGQWISALARMYASNGDSATRDKVLRLNRLFAESISPGFYELNRFPAYCYDKFTCGLIDSHEFANDPDAFDILHATTKIALPQLPTKAIPHDQNWRPGKDISWDWDESYTLPENQFLAYQRGAGEQYRDLAVAYLYDAGYFDLLAEGENAMAGKHAYSHVNALSSAMQAYLALGSEKHLRAAKNGFDIVTAQSFATGGWGPDEQLRATGSDDVAASLTKTHSSFETPCGAYAHFKLTRYLLMVTGDSRYGDSMERVMYNTVLGAKPLKPDGSAFYYSDYNFEGHKGYHRDKWPCCSGTLPQVAADYGINSYFRDERGLYVNLYIPSSVRWNVGRTRISLTQNTRYPFEDHVQFQLKMDRSEKFDLLLRIPEWARQGSISINEKRTHDPWEPGRFAKISRKWKNGDRVTLELGRPNRLEVISPQHRDIVAVVNGPLALFAVGDKIPSLQREQILKAKQVGGDQWQIPSNDGPITMLPFTSIEDEKYSLYLRTV